MNRKRFDIGEKIVCIDNEYEHIAFHFSLDKIYEVGLIPSKAYDNVGVKDDLGNWNQPNWNRFVSLKEYRKLKLKQLENG